MKLAKLLVPGCIYYPIIKIHKSLILSRLKTRILNYYNSVPSNQLDQGKKDALAFLKKYPISYFPYPFMLQYKKEKISVQWDDKKQLFYVWHKQTHKLYLKKRYTEENARGYYNSLLIEQDKASSHCYFSSNFNINAGDIIADVGTAEGSFALDALIQNAGFVYLFEPDQEWIEPLNATFEPWKDKVQIIHNFVSNKNDNENVSLDIFFKEKKVPDILKIDVEGMEEDVLNGASLLIKKHSLKIALCTYHKHDDYVKYTELLNKEEFEITTPENYILMIDDNLKPPYFRKGLVHAIKTNKS